MKIGNAYNAFVYTVAPSSIKTLYKQRLRWVYGFLKNAIDYRDMFFRPRYGHLGMVILPAAGFSIFSTMYFFGITVVNFVQSAILQIQEIMTVGISWSGFNFDPFYVNTTVIAFVSIIAVLGTIYIIVTSRGRSEEKTKFGLDSVAFLLFYSTIAPFWMTRALFIVIFSRNT